MATYQARYIHNISPSSADIDTAELPDGAFADRKALGAAMRKAGLLPPGGRLRAFRVEGDKVIAFPVWLVRPQETNPRQEGSLGNPRSLRPGLDCSRRILQQMIQPNEPKP